MNGLAFKLFCISCFLVVPKNKILSNSSRKNAVILKVPVPQILAWFRFWHILPNSHKIPNFIFFTFFFLSSGINKGQDWNYKPNSHGVSFHLSGQVGLKFWAPVTQPAGPPTPQGPTPALCWNSLFLFLFGWLCLVPSMVIPFEILKGNFSFL